MTQRLRAEIQTHRMHARAGAAGPCIRMHSSAAMLRNNDNNKKMEAIQTCTKWIKKVVTYSPSGQEKNESFLLIKTRMNLTKIRSEVSQTKIAHPV